MEKAKERKFKITESEAFKMITNKENQKVNEYKKLMEQRRLQRLCSYVSRIRQIKGSK